MSSDRPSTKRKLKFSIDQVRVSEQDSASVKRVLGRLTGRVPFPAEGEDDSPRKTGLPGPAGSTVESGSTELSGQTAETGITNHLSSTELTGNTDKSGPTIPLGSTTQKDTTEKSGSTIHVGTTKRSGTTRRTSTPGSLAPVSPERDFQKVPNSVTREAMAARLFRGKSKQVWDYLWSQSRGAVVPRRTVRRSRPQIKAGAGFGSMGTVDAAVDHLQAVGLLVVKTIVGESGGNEYEVFTPEEVAVGVFGLPAAAGTTTQTGNTETTHNPVAPVIPESGTTGSTLTATASAESGGPKTSFKTTEQTDDEAFANLVSLLQQTAKEVTGHDSPPSEAGRWAELAQVLVNELKNASARTTISSVPAFLAEHLRRRLSRPAAALPTKNTPAAGPPAPLPAPEPPTDDDLIGMFVNLLHSGLTMEEVEGQFLASVEQSSWPELKRRVLERYEAEKGVTGSPSA